MKQATWRSALRRIPLWLIAVVVVGVLCQLPIPPWLGLTLLLTPVFWLGPILIYLTHTRAAAPPIERFAAEQLSTLPAAHRQRFARALPELEALGLRPVGWVSLVQPELRLRGTKVLLQHPDTSDLAHLIVSGPLEPTARVSAVSLGFRLRRANGGWLTTGSSTLPSPRRPRAADDSLSLRGERSPAVLWELHRVRVAADPLAAGNPPIADALADELGLNAEEIAHCVASGYWRPADAGGELRPTPRGALTMTLRMLPPWKQVADLQAWQRCRRLRREAVPSGG